MHGFLDAAEPVRPHEYGRLSVAFDHGDGLGTPKVSYFVAQALPTRSATDASPIPSREPTHGSRQKWLVTPCLSAGLAPAVHARVSLAHPIHDPDAKGAWFGLNLTHGRGDLFRALIEGIAYGTGHVIETYKELGQRPSRVLAVGGGTKNRVWIQATSDICGLPQILCEKTLGASYGNAFLAASAIGAVSPDGIEQWNPVERTVVPEPTEAYRRQYPLFRRLYEQTKDIAADLAPAETC